jgi:CMP-N-acetylneuraminic acid synthetase
MTSACNPISDDQILCVIPARMGSTRIKHKNLRELTPGLSLVQQAIDTARGFTTCLSTDEPHHFSNYKDILVVERPPEISDAVSNVSTAIQHALEMAERKLARRFEVIVTLMPAIAARSASILRHMLSLHHASSGVCSSISCARTHPWIWKVSSEEAQNTWHPYTQLNSQDLPIYLVEHASMIINSRHVVAQGKKWDLPLLIYTLPSWSVALDIDDEQDLTSAAHMYSSLVPLLNSWRGDYHVINSVNSILPDQ